MSPIIEVGDPLAVVEVNDPLAVIEISDGRDAASIWGRQILSEVPSNNDILVWVSANSRYEHMQVDAIQGEFVLRVGDTMIGPLVIDGTTDAIQLRVQGYSTQTADIFVVETSAGTDLFQVATGAITASQNVNPNGDGTLDLGLTGTRWRQVYADDLTVTNGVAASTLTGTLQTAAQGNVTSLGTLTSLQVDNLLLDGNTLSSTAGVDLFITPLAGQQLILDGTIIIDAGVVTGATSITSTGFTGALTGNASSATVLANPRDINGVAFDGSTNITVTAAAGTLTGTVLNATVITSSLTSVAEAAVTAHEAALTILESQITDGAVFPRLGSTETIPGLWSFSNVAGLKTDIINERTGGTGVSIDGVLLKDSVVTADLTGNADSATLAATVTVVDSTNATSSIAMFDAATGSLAVKTDGGLTYDATTGILTATGFAGPLNGTVGADTPAAGSFTALSLTGTLTTQHVVPAANLTYDLGENGNAYRKLWANKIETTGTGELIGPWNFTTGLGVFFAGLRVLDDRKLYFGNVNRYWMLYDLTNTVFEFWSSTGGGGEVDSLVFSVQNLSADILFAGVATATGGFVGALTGNADTATLAATVTVVDSTNATSSIAMFDEATGSLAVKTDGGLTYNATTGVLTATGFAGPLTGAVTGNADSATTLATPRDINSVAFDGSQDITITAAAGTLTGTVLNSTVVSSSLTSLGVIASLVATTADINGGTADNVVIGGDVEAAGSFTTLAASGTSDLTGFINVGSGSVVANMAFRITADPAQYDASTSQYGARFTQVFSSSATVFGYGHYVRADIDTSQVFTMADLAHFYVGNPGAFGSATVTRQYGLYVEALVDAGTNYAIYTNAGLVRFGDAVSTTGTLTSTGLITATAGVLYGTTVTLTEASANVLELATGDSFNIVSGDLTMGAGAIKRANFGGYYWSAQGTAAVASAGAFVKVSTASSTTASETANFTITTDNRATYTGGTTQKFIVSYQFTCTGQNNEIAAFRIAKNGTTIAGSEVARKIGTGLDEGATAVHFIVELATNDYVELWATNQDGTGNVFVEHGVLLITEA